jgi:predicted TIM-barrel fold metal-dependent hydrolase
LQWALFNTERPIVDTLAALVLHNLFGRFPGVRVATIENGSDWVGHLFKMMEKAVRMTKRGPMLGGPLTDTPTDIFKEHVFVCPFPEDDVPALIDTVGPDRVLFGSDYPHPEGMRVPLDFLDFLKQYDAVTIDKVMYATAGNMLGLNS